MSSSFHNLAYSIGCPVWNCEAWSGKIYPGSAKREQWLDYYSQVFSTVEGNSTFYGLPSVETVQRWGQRAAKGFEFCLKFPRAITHDSQLLNCDLHLEAFIARLQVLQDAGVLGPSLLQLPPNFSPGQFDDLARFIERLPKRFSYAVEVRHPDWFVGYDNEALNELLVANEVDRVMFDSRPLFSKQPTDETEVESQRRKPNLPVEFVATSQRPMLRLIGRNEIGEVMPWMDQWIQVIGDWIQQGMRPIVFTHTPDDQLAPDFAKLLHNQLVSALTNSGSPPGSDGLQPFQDWPHWKPIQGQLF